MVCDASEKRAKALEKLVLILILLEYGLRHKKMITEEYLEKVLILILLEYGLRHI